MATHPSKNNAILTCLILFAGLLMVAGIIAAADRLSQLCS
jgi:hypothetical protein